MKPRKPAYSVSDRQGMKMVSEMRKRGDALFAEMTRPRKPLQPDDVRVTHNTITRTNKDEK